MALKGSRVIGQTEVDIHYFMNVTGERGYVVVHNTTGSGEALDQAQQTVTVSANPSGKVPVGILLNDVVNLDLTRQMINRHKDEVQVGSKVAILRRGRVVTNAIEAAATPTAGEPAYLANSGLLSDAKVNVPNNPIVGRWDSAKDEDGYAAVYINLPMTNAANE